MTKRKQRKGTDPVSIHKRTTRIDHMPTKVHDQESRRSQRRTYKQRVRYIDDGHGCVEGVPDYDDEGDLT